MIVIRVDRHGNLCDSKPCVLCAKIIKSSGIKKLYYSVNGGLIVINVNKFTSNHQSKAQRNYV